MTVSQGDTHNLVIFKCVFLIEQKKPVRKGQKNIEDAWKIAITIMLAKNFQVSEAVATQNSFKATQLAIRKRSLFLSVPVRKTRSFLEQDRSQASHWLALTWPGPVRPNMTS